MMKPDYWGYGTERLPGGKLNESRLRSNSSLW